MLDACEPLLRDASVLIVELLLEKIPASLDDSFLRLVCHHGLVRGAVKSSRVEVAF